MPFSLDGDLLSSLDPLAFYAPSTPTDTTGLVTLIESVIADAASWQSIAEVAYFFATIKWETAHTFKPIHELGSLSYFDKYNVGTALGARLGNTQAGDGFLFRGRGYVQITGRDNYQHIGTHLGVDLAGNADLALDPDVAYKIAASGMHNGWFTSRRLSQYVSLDPPDYLNARRIINGIDHASDIAAIAKTFEVLLTPPAPPDADSTAPAADRNAPQSVQVLTGP